MLVAAAGQSWEQRQGDTVLRGEDSLLNVNVNKGRLKVVGVQKRWVAKLAVK